MKHKIYSLLEKCINTIPLLMVYFVISTITYSYIRYYTFDKNSKITYSKYYLLIIGIFFLIMIIICHTLCLIMNPRLKDQSKDTEIRKKEEIFKDSSQVDLPDDESFCKKCETYRPNRSHHCKTCNRCIIKMDHHCPWIANCVGYNNHKYFLLFLFYTILGCTIAFCGLVIKFYEVEGKLNYYFAFYKFLFRLFITFDDKKSDNSFEDKVDILLLTNSTDIPVDSIGAVITYDNPTLDPVLILISTLMSLFTIAGVATLFSFQIYLISNNLSGIEYHKYIPKERSPYYNSNALQNLKNLLGDKFMIWFFPVFYSSKNDHEFLKVKTHSMITL